MNATAPRGTPDVLHCYAQSQWHDDAYISGGRVALQALRDAIDIALRDGIGEVETFTSDGEGYSLFVVAMTEQDALRQAVPYSDALLFPFRLGSFGPWDTIRDADAAVVKEKE